MRVYINIIVIITMFFIIIINYIIITILSWLLHSMIIVQYISRMLPVWLAVYKSTCVLIIYDKFI